MLHLAVPIQPMTVAAAPAGGQQYNTPIGTLDASRLTSKDPWDIAVLCRPTEEKKEEEEANTSDPSGHLVDQLPGAVAVNDETTVTKEADTSELTRHLGGPNAPSHTEEQMKSHRHEINELLRQNSLNLRRIDELELIINGGVIVTPPAEAPAAAKPTAKKLRKMEVIATPPAQPPMDQEIAAKKKRKDGRTLFGNAAHAFSKKLGRRRGRGHNRNSVVPHTPEPQGPPPARRIDLPRWLVPCRSGVHCKNIARCGFKHDP